ncbi:MAG: SpvB/TcaC N-terminal domain-containing protein [Marinoscillum sp.]
MNNTSNQNVTDNKKISVQEISFPKGGGAISGIGNSFKTNSFSGGGTYSIPVPVTPARGFEPQLMISYSSGAGNGIFGLGFSLSSSKISIKTNKGIPKYDGTGEYELDGGTLVEQNNSTSIPNPRMVNYEGQVFKVTRYLPEIESTFSKIEHWRNDKGHSFWKVITANNVTSYYGIDTKIANPTNPSQVFEWLIDNSTDNKGNQIVYSYFSENAINVPDKIYELNRSVTSNRYIQKIQYGNYVDKKGKVNFSFELVFNYGPPGHNTDTNWPCRKDPFSSYKSGFEIRTFRSCQSIQLVHVFPEEQVESVVVKELSFTYENIQQYGPVPFQGMSMLTKVALTGFREAESQVLPPLEFSYSAFQPPVAPEFKKLSMGENTIPGYLNAQHFLPVDLKGEGLPGFLISNDSMSLYLEPLGNGKYQLPVANSSFPINKNIQDGGAMLADLDGNGRLDLVVNTHSASGSYTQTFEGKWDDFVPFRSYPTVISDPHMEMVDLSATGKSDLLLVDTNNLLYFPSEGSKGYSTSRNVPVEKDFPLIKQGYQQELVTFSNMFGDGLSHRVKITNGSVECWPCLGYGQFGEKITFANAPSFGENFDTSRLFLTDVDGSGTTDLAYVYPDRVELFLNASGNSFSDAIIIRLPELFNAADQISFTDILGNGTACLVFTKIAPVPKHYYYNFSGEVTLPDGSLKQSLKPYLLNKIDNNMGLISYVNYCSSTKFILEDKLAGKPWVTKLPFPVQVVEELIHYELSSKSRYLTKYKYHDGYYDPDQKQFLGFGFIESWDSETYESFHAGYSNPDFPVNALNKELFVPPVYTKTWYLNGATTLEYERLLAKYKSEYFSQDTNAYKFPDSTFSPHIYGSSEKTFKQAYNALASKVIRTEVYGLDDTDDAATPYSVEESNYNVELIQPAVEGQYAVFLVNQNESITYQYERNAKDPRVQQEFILEVDKRCGKVKKSCMVFLPRRSGSTTHYSEQKQLKITAQYNDYINTSDEQSYRYRGVPCQTQSFEIFGFDLKGKQYCSFSDIKRIKTVLSHPLPYQAPLTPGELQARQLTWNKNFFWNEAQTDSLDLGQISSRALAHHNEAAMFTKEFVSEVFGPTLSDDFLQSQGGYDFDTQSGYWWNKGLVQYYFDSSQPASFYLPCRTENAFVDPSSSLFVKSTVDYNQPYNFSIVKSTQYIDEANKIENVVTAEIDYLTLLPYQLTDINGNVSQALFDPLGQVIVTSLFGTENGKPVGGMRLYPYNGKPIEYVNHNDATFDDVVDNSEKYLQGATSYFYYNLLAWKDQPQQPPCSINLIRDDFYLSAQGITAFACKTSINYSDGLGRALESKVKTEPGLAYIREMNGHLTLDSDNKPLEALTNDRWIVSGRTVYNNKGKPCEQYLPYFSNTPHFETQEEIVNLKLVPPPTVTNYDPLLRVIRIDTPKGFYSKVEFSPWEEKHYDEDDTVKDSVYFINFMDNYPKLPKKPDQTQIDEKDALDKASIFYNTPTISILDNVGNTIRTIQNNLGSVNQSAFANIVEGGITSEQLFNELVTKGYLVTYSTAPVDAWVTDKFQPYVSGFVLDLDNPYKQFSGKVTDLLKQNCLTSFSAYDIQGRPTIKIDPRLYYANQSTGTEYYNFKYRYAMGQKGPVYVNSIDAGVKKLLSNIFNKRLWSLSPRNYCQLITYDRLQRRSALQVKKLTNNQPITSYADFNVVGVFEYGESPSASQKNNLRGQLWRLHDLSGVLINSQYGLQQEILETSRQMASDYKSAITWNCLPPPAPKQWNPLPAPTLEAEIYSTQFTYNALGLMITEKTPDGTVSKNAYNRIGLLNQVSVTFDNKPEQQVIKLIEYDAKGQRTTIQYSNGITTIYDYEPSTLRLIGLLSTRQGTPVEKVQNTTYTHDPVGNITRTWNKTFETLFPDKQLDPLSDYTYDALYQLTRSNGQQHLGISANTYKNNSKDGDFKQCLFSQLPDINNSDKLEDYSEVYSYDAAGNLTNKQHIAASLTWSKKTAVEANSNRLSCLPYDASGNPGQLDINNPVKLSFNCFENLVGTGIIERPDEPETCDYYTYGVRHQRTRTVSERFSNGGLVSQIEEKVYLGNFEIKSIKNGAGQSTLKMQTLRVMGGNICAAIIHNWVKGNGPNGLVREFRYQVVNDESSVSLEYDNNANLLSYEEYFPYGGTSIIAGADQEVVSLKDYRYTGKECNDGTGLYYYGDRYYAPWLGRWLNSDPSGPHHDLNLYSYVTDDPTTYTDPTGETRAQLEAQLGKPIVAKMAKNMDAAFRYLTTTEVTTMQTIAATMEGEITKGMTAYSAPTRQQFTGEFDQYKILNFAHNPVLADLWTDSMNKIQYPGSYSPVKLYTMARGHFTKLIKDQYSTEFDYMQLGKPPEIHHAEYKSLAPSQALNPANLWLFSRGSKAKGLFGQHELIHQMSAANHANYYSVEPTQTRQVLAAERKSTTLMHPDSALASRFKTETARFPSSVQFDPFK